MQKLTFYVIAAHIALFTLLCFNITPPPLEIPKKFAVKTVSLKAEESFAIAETPPQPTPTPSPPTPPPPTPPQPTPPPPTPPTPKKTTTTPTKPPPKQKTTPAPSSKKNDSIMQAKKALADLKLTSTPTPVTPQKNQIGDLNIEGLKGDHYFSDIITKMQHSMKFPDAGEVIVELTLKRDGQVLKMSIKEAKSLLNKMYVEKTLPSIKFPMFEGSLKHEETHTFIVVLNSVALD